MAHILVANEGATLLVQIDTTSHPAGWVIARCPFHGEIADGYNLEDIIEAAMIHVENNHE